ncbi:zinc finger protein CONSTANS-LIKE 5 [Carica papaya]|uniref:zinc finger protein CONSTANS-LIKE 5 n=1 Tax=Carica papaya TaxID=3649 RepID=UPI000B8C862F|nr:zinc finger protein CONSTANS-LIKE 5 [Carica papaya]
MGIEFQGVKGIAVGWAVTAKPCDTCKSAAAALFCRVDSAFLCLACDSRIHSLNKLASRHERVWMCEVCEQAPAAVTCKADAAALCVICDADIHSANPLARRHERVPVEPFFDAAESVIKSTPSTFLMRTDNVTGDYAGACQHEDVEVGSWLLPNYNLGNSKFNMETDSCVDMKSGDLVFPDMDPFLDFDYHNSFPQHRSSAATDGVAPVQTKPTPVPVINNENFFDIEFCRSKLSSFNNQNQSLSQSVSSSSLDFGVVPDGNSVSDISYNFGRNMSDPSVPVSCINAATTASQATQLCGIDREARVLRYREKRKNRKFEKTIRYASRKAYAESRPRIKGRFAKRTEAETDLESNYDSASSTAFMADTPYGVVPSF